MYIQARSRHSVSRECYDPQRLMAVMFYRQYYRPPLIAREISRYGPGNNRRKHPETLREKDRSRRIHLRNLSTWKIRVLRIEDVPPEADRLIGRRGIVFHKATHPPVEMTGTLPFPFGHTEEIDQPAVRDSRQPPEVFRHKNEILLHDSVTHGRILFSKSTASKLMPLKKIVNVSVRRLFP
jgi:hypothetical protein